MAIGVLVCQGHVAGPKLLDGRTGDGSVALTNNSEFSGTRWQLIEQPNNIVILKCLGDVDGPRFLDGHAADSSVHLAPNTNAPFSGTRWLRTRLADRTMRCAAWAPVRATAGSWTATQARGRWPWRRMPSLRSLEPTGSSRSRSATTTSACLSTNRPRRLTVPQRVAVLDGGCRELATAADRPSWGPVNDHKDHGYQAEQRLRSTRTPATGLWSPPAGRLR